MKVQFTESCAGDTFMYSRGEVVESSNEKVVERLKELVRAGHAVELQTERKERANVDLGKVEKR